MNSDLASGETTMTPFDRLIKFIFSFNITPWFLVKVLVLVGTLVYVAFGAVVVRQVNLMAKALNVELETIIRLVAWIHLCAAIGLFFLALIVL